MLEKIEYIEKNGTAMIYRCYGDGSVVELPDTLHGLPVTELADHCFAREVSVRYKKFQLKSILREEWENTDSQECSAKKEENEEIFAEKGTRKKYSFGEMKATGELEYSPLCGDEIQEIVLPKYLEGTGDYVFYGCLNLTTVHFPASMKRLGGGAFVACNKVRNLHFTVNSPEETPYCMKDVLGELIFEVEVVLKDEKEKTLVQLTYPEYYEESVENTPARIIDIAFHGMGYMYRQCFKGRVLDYYQYDSLFHLTVSQEFLPTVMQMTFNRLKTPVGLTETSRKKYLEFLQKEQENVARWIFEKDRIELLYLLGTVEYFTEENLEQFLKTASNAEAAEAVSYLMDYRRSHFAPEKKKKYVF